MSLFSSFNHFITKIINFYIILKHNHVISSVSCVCSALVPDKFTVSDVIFRKRAQLQGKTKETSEKTIKPVVPFIDSSRVAKGDLKPTEGDISGRFSMASYSNLSSLTENTQRFRYTLMLNSNGLLSQKVNTEAYITFAHRLNQWDVVKADIFNALRIYSLAVHYQFNTNHGLWFGRRINQRMASLGAVDGLQYEWKSGAFTTGVIAGSRPDVYNYGINTKLLQAGAYVAHDFKGKSGFMQSTAGVVEQTNNGYTDRRFVYLQHINSLLKKLYFFGSAEVDLFNKKLIKTDSSLVQDNSPVVTNLYLSLRYRIVSQLSVGISYSARNNIIYYETYKTYLERLLELETSTGYLFQVNWHPGKRISLGLNAGYRDQKGSQRASKNLYSYLSFNRFLFENVTANASVTLLETPYMNGDVFSFGLNGDLFKGKLFAGTTYRNVNYRFVSGETSIRQHIGEVSLLWRTTRNFTASLNAECTFETGVQYQRIYLNLTQRF
ncbi:MAG: hypothetical protein A2X11_12775 [Bacteroidetes bacterium GWE2_42_24]|nr:MAG: hypothetical protein A2X11_12775 [Bacteroidetes bacterium GWE2_42_24]OFY32258.1 MAG: hypothetical protein A2X09_13795 [Bacteroidetes bacterium GWF2_43_11]HCU20676.1 hypothetical protein [Bacteroidales bacterium]